MKSIYENLKRIPLWRIIMAVIILLGLSFSAHAVLLYKGRPSFQEMTLTHLNDITTFNLYFILLLIVAGLGFKGETGNAKDANRGGFGRNLKFIAFICFLYIAVFLVFNILSMLLQSGSVNFSDEWRGIKPEGFEFLTPSLATAVCTLLVYLRLVFLACLVFVINSRCLKMPFGYAGGFAVCLFDGIMYFNVFPQEPTGVFPYEHSNLLYVFGLTRFPVLDVFLSVLYWLILIAAAGLIYRLLDRQRKPVPAKEGICYGRNNIKRYQKSAEFQEVLDFRRFNSHMHGYKYFFFGVR